ncbi:MAG: cyclic nucleotide-binding domain-containing protein, partial [Pseudomonadales bacterium]
MDAFLQHCQRRRYPAKSTIIFAGEQGESLYYIISGTVTVVLEDDEGREMIIAYINKNEFFGELGI